VLLSNDVANDDAINVHAPLVRALCEPVECKLPAAPLAPAGEDRAAARAYRQCVARRLVALQPEALTMDPLAAALVLRPSIFELQLAHVCVDERTGVTAECAAGRGTAVQLAVRIDCGEYERLLRDELLCS